ncbi:hypothetical protein ACQP2F_19995 [Actinoplanes sp. CA-030573]|uniref:hypothetical protein n=1 Tax=Actinoplanes sp. CA-030573 TaxID=3239898 RepID=UPI003D8E812A
MSEPAEPRPPATLTVDAELVDPGDPAPRPGDMFIVSLMLYRVLAVRSGAYSDPFILVGHRTPDLGSPEFRRGVRHRLRLTAEFPPHATVVNRFESQAGRSSVWYCTSHHMMEPG